MKDIGKLRFRFGRSTNLDFSDKHAVVQVSWQSAAIRIFVVLLAVTLIDDLVQRCFIPQLQGISLNSESLIHAGFFLILVTPVLYVVLVMPLLSHVAERAQAEEALLMSERQFRTLFESMSEGLALHDVVFADDGTPVNYRITDVNPQYEAILGLSREFAVGKLATEAYGTPEPPYLHEYVSVAQTNTNHVFETYFAPLDKHFMISVVPFGADKFAAIFFDVTELKKAEEAIRASEANYRAIFDAAGDAIMVLDLDTGDIMDVNRKACEMYGYTRREIRRLSIEELSIGEHPYTQQDALRWIRKASKGRSQMFEWQAKDRSGRVFWVEFHLKRATIGGHHRLLASVRDISERKQAEEVSQARAFWEGIAQTMHNGLVVMSSEGTITYANSAFCELIGQDRTQLIGEIPPHSWWVEESDGQQAEMWGGIFSADEVRNHRGSVLHRTGRRIPVLANVSNLLDAEGTSISRLAVFQNISTLVDMEEQLVRKERLALLGQLAGSIGHELRNPLGVVQSSVYYLRTRLVDADEKIARHLERLENSVAFSDKVITDLLSFARIPGLYRNPMDIEAFIRKLLEDFATEGGATICVSSEGDSVVLADETQMIQLFRNLIANALDAMEGSGQLSIRICRTIECLEVAICDTGAGIPEENLEKVFEPLFSTKARGAGFGLAICKKIVESHGGSISITSEPGKGTQVLVSLPM